MYMYQTNNEVRWILIRNIFIHWCICFVLLFLLLFRQRAAGPKCSSSPLTNTNNDRNNKKKNTYIKLDSSTYWKSTGRESSTKFFPLFLSSASSVDKLNSFFTPNALLGNIFLGARGTGLTYEEATGSREKSVNPRILGHFLPTNWEKNLFY